MATCLVELERESPVPLYLQIKEHLIRDIAAVGVRRDKFYTDSELCAKCMRMGLARYEHGARRKRAGSLERQRFPRQAPAVNRYREQWKSR